MSDECSKIADELLKVLEQLKVKSDAKHRGWKSFRQALKSVWSQVELDELSERLERIKDELQFQTLVSMKGNCELLAIRQSQRFNTLDTATQSLLQAILDNGDIFTSKIDSQTITITGLHAETRALVECEARKTRAEIVDALRVPSLPRGGHQPGEDEVSIHHCQNSAEDLRIQDIILQTLRFPTMNDRYEAIEEAHAKTCNWIFEELHDDEKKQWDSFSRWLQSPDSIYWISGKAGSGKSTLMRYISEDPRLGNLLQSWTGGLGDLDLVIGTFFFWISGTADQASQVGLLRSLLFTLLSSRQHLTELTFPDLWSDLKSSISPVEYAQTYSWTLSKLTNGFRRLFSQDVGHVFLLIDGLDEYKGDPAELVEIIRSIISPEVKICVSSRPWQIFEDSFRETPKLRLQDLTSGDISLYVNEVLRSDEKMRDLCASDPEEAPKLIDEIVAKANGVFLWVALVVKSFLTGLTNRDRISHLRKRLQDIPPKIEDLYVYMLTKIEPIYHEEGSRIFSAVALALHRDLHYTGGGICAIHLSFAIEDDEDLARPTHLLTREEAVHRISWIDTRLKVSCAGLLELHSPGLGPQRYNSRLCFTRFGNREIQYIHRTARDFLATRESQITPIGKYRSTTYHPATYMMRSNVLYLKHCMKDCVGSDLVRQGLDGIFKRTMWLALKAELETGRVQAEILDELERVTINFESDDLPDSKDQLPHTFDWSSLMPTALDNEASRMHQLRQCVDYISVIISWGLNLYLEWKLCSEEKSGSHYLDHTLRVCPKASSAYWDIKKTVSILLAHDGNPNFGYNCEAFGEEQTTPWQAMLLEIWKISPICASELTNRRPDDLGDNSTLPEVIGQLFELLLLNGADPHAKSAPLHNHRSGRPERYAVSDVIKRAFKEYPNEQARLLALLKDSKISEAAKGERQRGGIYRLTAKLKFGKKGSK